MAGIYDNEYLLTRCSICFDSKYEFCLAECKDQFCKECFEKYVSELVKNSWGMKSQAIKCPACLVELESKSWTLHVSPELASKYAEYNQPFRILNRFCSCGESLSLAYPPCQSSKEREIIFESIFFETERILGGEEEGILAQYQEDYLYALKDESTSVFQIYKALMQDVVAFLKKKCRRQKTLDSHFATLSRISKQFTLLELNPELWKETQFFHISNFPKTTCNSCLTTVCFSCGEAPYHNTLSCQDHLERKLANYSKSTEMHKNLLWQLENSKRCPKCSITISRDEGCLKMDCVYCGYKFCWNCLEEFIPGRCGFYNCHFIQIQNQALDSNIDASKEDVIFGELEEGEIRPESYEPGEMEHLDVPTEISQQENHNFLLKPRTLSARKSRSDSGLTLTPLATSPPESGVPDVMAIADKFIARQP